MIRLAEGEGKAMALWPSPPAPLLMSELEPVLNEHLRKVAAVKWRNWFGVLPPVIPEAVNLVGEQVAHSVRSADAIGLRPQSRHQRTFTAWQDSGKTSLADVLAFDGLARVFAEQHGASLLLPMDSVVAWNADGTLAEAVAAAERVVLVTGYAEAAEYLAGRTGANIACVRIPSERKPSVPTEVRAADEPGKHLLRFAAIRDEVRELSGPGVLVLVAGGLLGKVYVHDASSSGAVAIDIGAVVDGWLGLSTRPRLQTDRAKLDFAPQSSTLKAEE